MQLIRDTAITITPFVFMIYSFYSVFKGGIFVWSIKSTDPVIIRATWDLSEFKQ